jgi:hypothetical protein
MPCRAASRHTLLFLAFFGRLCAHGQACDSTPPHSQVMTHIYGLFFFFRFNYIYHRTITSEKKFNISVFLALVPTFEEHALACAVCRGPAGRLWCDRCREKLLSNLFISLVLHASSCCCSVDVYTYLTVWRAHGGFFILRGRMDEATRFAFRPDTLTIAAAKFARN